MLRSSTAFDFPKQYTPSERPAMRNITYRVARVNPNEASTDRTLSPLLGLPGELHNRIYEYVLIVPTERYWEKRSPKEENGSRSISQTCLKLVASFFSYIISPYLQPTRFNELQNTLKFVNRQLYAETAGLEYYLNDLVFVPTSASTNDVAHRLFRFLDSTPDVDPAWLRRIILEPSGFSSVSSESNTKIVKLARLCKKCPRLHIKYILYEYFSTRLDPIDFTIVGMHLNSRLRNKHLSFQVPVHQSIALLGLQRWVLDSRGIFDNWEDEELSLVYDVSNLSFWPSQPMSLEKFEATLRQCGQQMGLHEGYVSVWCQFTKVWITNGI